MDRVVRGCPKPSTSKHWLAKLAVPCIFVTGIGIARTTAAQDPPPAPPADPSATPPAPTDTAPPPTATEPTPPPPEPTPTETAPPPPPPPSATTPAPPPTWLAPPPSTQPKRSQPPPARTAPPPPPPPRQPTAAAPPPEPPPPPPPPPKKEDEEDDTDGLFGPFRLGPVVGVGLPNLLSFGGTAKLTRYLGGGINIGLIPTVKISYYGEATLSYQEYDIYGRLYPFGGMFFLGAGVGYETVKGKLSNTFDLAQSGIPGASGSIDVLSEASVKTMVLTPQMGIFHTWGSGFSLGLDFGAQVPIAPSKVNFSTTVPAASSIPGGQATIDTYITGNDQKVRDSLEKIGRTIIPTINFRIGWLL